MPDHMVIISKFLSLILRHRPDTIGIFLDKNGWVDVDELIERVNQACISLTKELVELVVATNDKQRFALSEDGTKIRANQGHSIPIDLGLEAAQPPEILYHGTAWRHIESIKKQG